MHLLLLKQQHFLWQAMLHLSAHTEQGSGHLLAEHKFSVQNVCNKTCCIWAFIAQISKTPRIADLGGLKEWTGHISKSLQLTTVHK